MRSWLCKGCSLVILGAYLAGTGTASGADRIGTRPGSGGEADEITIRVGLLDIVDIDNHAQLFTVDLFVLVQWRDRRLAADDDEPGQFRTYALGDIWSPRLAVINDRGLDRLLPDVATVDRQGNVVLRQRLAGPLAVELDLHQFPFDVQRLPIEIVSYQYSPEELVFSAESEMISNLDMLGGNGWTYHAVEPEISVYRLSDRGPGSSQLTFAVMAKREAGYYVLTLALPMTLILFLAWMVHWLPPDIIPARMGMASATVFSLIAFGVSVRLTLPEIAYLTAADRFVLYSTLLVLASLVVTVTSTIWVNSERRDAALRLTRRARIAFPFLYIIVLLTLAV